MIRTIIIFLFFYLAFSCGSQKQVSENKNETISLASLRDKYKVVRIDSIKNVFVIYARKDSSWYKIVSLKDTFPCTRIKVGEDYPLVLMSRVPKEFRGENISPSVIPHITGIDFYGVSIPFERDSINDIFVATNLKGLCMQ